MAASHDGLLDVFSERYALRMRKIGASSMVVIFNGCVTRVQKEGTQHQIASNRTATARLRVAGWLGVTANGRKL